MSRYSSLPAIVRNLNCFFFFGCLFAHVLADQCACAKLKDCVSCIIGRNPQDIYGNPTDPAPYYLQVMQKPEVILDAKSPDNKAYSTLSFPDNACNITCFWNKQLNSCADFQIANIASFKANPNPNLVAPTILDVDIFAMLQFDLYTRFDNSRGCQDGLVFVGAITFPPYLLSPNVSSSCYGPCSNDTQYRSTYACSL